MEKNMNWIVLSEYTKDGRMAKIYDTQDGYTVELYENGDVVDTRDLSGHTLRYAEDCAENWIEGIIA